MAEKLAAEKLTLSLAFLAQHPKAAGEALGAMEPADAAALLDRTPARLAVPALAAVGASRAAPILSLMKPETAAALLSAADFLDAAAALRAAPAEARKALLAALPEPLKKDFETSLDYPDDCAGAHMTTSIITLPPECSAADARTAMRQSKDSAADIIFVVNEERRFAGAVAPSVLLRAAKTETLSALIDTSVKPVSARASLHALEDNPPWGVHSWLPVVSRQGLVMGAISQEVVARQSSPQRAFEPHPSFAVSLTGAFIDSIVGVSRVLFDAQPAPSPRKGGAS